MSRKTFTRNLAARALLLALALAAPVLPQARERAVRIAVIGFSNSAIGPALDGALEDALRRDSRVIMIERSLMKPALAGVGYDGSINMSTDEARRLGAAIGCDFFLIGAMNAEARSDRARESHEEAVGGLMMVDGRTGALAAFDFIQEKAASREAALEQARRTIAARAPQYIERMLEHRARLEEPSGAHTAFEPVEDIPEGASPRFTPPEFLNRVKPEYPAEANRANAGGTVEAMAVFRANGEVGEITVTRWAGFGMEESARRAIRELKFKPATLDGKPVSVRALVRYNFRRLEFVDAKEPEPVPEKPSGPDLRNLFKREPRRPPLLKML